MVEDARRVSLALTEICEAYSKARAKHGQMKSMLEGYAVILEELDEAWAEIKLERTREACHEIAQLGAMAARFLACFSEDY